MAASAGRDASLSSTRLPPPIDTGFLGRLQQNPAAVLKRIQRLYSNRTNGMHNGELYEQLNWLHRAIDIDRQERVSIRLWSVLMKSCKLADVYVELVQTDNFFEDPATVCAVFAGLANVAKGCRAFGDSVTERLLLSRCSSVLQSVWRNRESLRRIGSEHLGADVEGHPVLRCMAHFVELHRLSRGFRPGFGSYFPEVALFGWVHLGDARFSLEAMKFLTEDAHSPIAQETLNAFVEGTVLSAVGARALFARFEQTLGDEAADGYASVVMHTMLFLAEHPSLYPLLQKHKTFRFLVESLCRRSLLSGTSAERRKAAWHEWDVVFKFYKHAIKDAFEAVEQEDFRSTTVRGEDILAFFAVGSGWVAQAAFRRDCDEYKTFDGKCKEIRDEMTTLGFCAALPDWKRIAPAFAAGLARGARAHYSPVMDAITAGKLFYGPESLAVTAYSDLWYTWTRIAVAVRMDLDQERRKTSRRCSYQLCPFYILEPPGGLSVCKGCGDVRYCSRDCQRAKWSIHKKVCGKRLK